MIIAIVGSSSLKREILNYAKEKELEGNICIMSHIFSHSDNYELNEDQVQIAIENGHKRIDIADKLVVVTKEGYIGDSTREEIQYCQNNYPEKEISFYCITNDKE